MFKLTFNGVELMPGEKVTIENINNKSCRIDRGKDHWVILEPNMPIEINLSNEVKNNEKIEIK